MKAVGPDGIPNEFYIRKEERKLRKDYLTYLKACIDEEEEVPIEWNKVQVKLAFKHGKKETKKGYKKLQTSGSSKCNKQHILWNN